MACVSSSTPLLHNGETRWAGLSSPLEPPGGRRTVVLTGGFTELSVPVLGVLTALRGLCGMIRRRRALRRANFRTHAYLPSSAQTALPCRSRSWRSSAPFGAGMFSDVVTERVPSAVDAAHCT